ncbi:MAG TPA: sigma-70 family RNA polymerase sigma factor [Myxococcales bacterium]|nr:sigma-70 family RNA polymerase sigma factor [Myxococcales bacterium]
MSAYARGDRRSFALLFRRWAPRLHGFFLKSVRERSIADDLLQLTFLKVHRARASFQPVLRLRAWLYTIAVRELREEMRRRRRAPLAGDEQDRDVQSGPDDPQRSMELQQRTNAVRAAIARLPEAQREILYLHRYEEMTFGEIAAALGATEGAVRIRAFRAYERLREELAGLLDEERAA